MPAPGIRGRHSDKCVDNYDFDTTPGALVRLYTCNGNAAQEFEFTYRGANGYEIRNRNTGTCLDDINASTAANADVGLYPCNGVTRSAVGHPGPWATAGSPCATSPATCAWTTTTGTRPTAPASRSTLQRLHAQLWRRG